MLFITVLFNLLLYYLKNKIYWSQEGDRIDFIDLFLDAESTDINEQNGNYDHKAPIKVFLSLKIFKNKNF